MWTWSGTLVSFVAEVSIDCIHFRHFLSEVLCQFDGQYFLQYFFLFVFETNVPCVCEVCVYGHSFDVAIYRPNVFDCKVI